MPFLTHLYAVNSKRILLFLFFIKYKGILGHVFQVIPTCHSEDIGSCEVATSHVLKVKQVGVKS